MSRKYTITWICERPHVGIINIMLIMCSYREIRDPSQSLPWTLSLCKCLSVHFWDLKKKQNFSLYILDLNIVFSSFFHRLYEEVQRAFKHCHIYALVKISPWSDYRMTRVYLSQEKYTVVNFWLTESRRVWENMKMI